MAGAGGRTNPGRQNYQEARTKSKGGRGSMLCPEKELGRLIQLSLHAYNLTPCPDSTYTFSPRLWHSVKIHWSSLRAPERRLLAVRFQIRHPKTCNLIMPQFAFSITFLH